MNNLRRTRNDSAIPYNCILRVRRDLDDGFGSDGDEGRGGSV